MLIQCYEENSLPTGKGIYFNENKCITFLFQLDMEPFPNLSRYLFCPIFYTIKCKLNLNIFFILRNDYVWYNYLTSKTCVQRQCLDSSFS